MKALSIAVLLVASIAHAQNFNPITDKHCANTNGKADYTLILKNANIGEPTGYTVLQYANSKSNVVKENSLTIIDKKRSSDSVTTLFAEDFVLRVITKKADNTYTDEVVLVLDDDAYAAASRNDYFYFICEKVESN